MRSLSAEEAAKVKKLSFSKTIEISQPVRELQIQDAERKQSFFNQPAVLDYVKKVKEKSFENGFEQGVQEGVKKKTGRSCLCSFLTAADHS